MPRTVRPARSNVWQADTEEFAAMPAAGASVADSSVADSSVADSSAAEKPARQSATTSHQPPPGEVAPRAVESERVPPRRIAPREQGARKRRGRRRWPIVALVGLLVLGACVWFGLREFFGIGYSDYSGTGDSDIVVRVQDGESTRAIASDLAQKDVVASSGAFLHAGENNAQLQSIQPGYYQLKTKMSSAAAVSALTDPKNRVGELQVKAGSVLADVKQPDGSTTDGIFTMLAKASCAKINGKSTCVSVEDLKKAANSADLTSLGVPSWAADASKAQPGHRLEGLIPAGVYDVKPGDSAQDILKSVLTTSAAAYQQAGMPQLANNSGYSPYQILVIASLLEKEAIKPDFGKVARVTYNRLSIGMKLQYDSTINYVLDQPDIRTKESDRSKAGPYNTYANKGLPPTPISSPDADALTAAANPTPGKWLYFVKCYKTGESCFAETAEQHSKDVREAQARGAY